MYETRSVPGSSLTDYNADRGEFTARVLNYNRADHHGSVWRHKVFSKSLQRALPAACWGHDLRRVIGRAVDADDKPDGLDMRVRLADPEAVPDARMARSLLGDKIVDEFSFTLDRHPGSTLMIPREQRSSFGELPAREIITSADLIEVSPVVGASGVDTKLLDVRSQEGSTMEAPTPTEIAALVQAKVITPEQGAALLGDVLPVEMRERIVVSQSKTMEQRVIETLEVHDPSLAAEVRASTTLTAPGAVGNMDNEPASVLAQAVDAALDGATDLLDGTDLSSLPDNVAQAVGLVYAGGEAVDALLEAMDIEDPDEQRSRETETRGQIGTKDRNDLPDSAFAYIEPGGDKDADGKTVPRSKRHFPIVDAAHVRDALARIGGGAEFGKEALPKVEAAAKKLGVKVSSKRSVDAEDRALRDLEKRTNRHGISVLA